MMKNAMRACGLFIALATQIPLTIGQVDKFNLPPVFPIPQEAAYEDESFKLNPETVVLLPLQPSENDRFLAGLVVSEISAKHDFVLKTEPTASLAGRSNFLLIGAVSNPLVREYGAEQEIPVAATNPGHEGYFLQVNSRGAVVLGSDEPGAFYGLQSLRQLISHQNVPSIRHATIRDWPQTPFRGIHLYLPGPDNIGFYKRFVRDCLAYFKFNKIIMEVGAGMRFDRHPELNAGWREFTRDMFYTQRDRPLGPYGDGQVASHTEVADGQMLDKQQVADLVAYARQYNIEVIPEVQSLTHSYYLLSRHRELAEIRAAEWPDTYCPLNPGSYELYFDVLDEYIEVMKPRMVHIGHDEWRMPVNVCERCKGRDYAELFIQDVVKIHDYLTAKNIRVAMWGDHLDRGPGLQNRTAKGTGKTYQIPGALTPEQVQKYIPRDILICNWSWHQGNKADNVKKYQEWGFEQVLGNLATNLDGHPDNKERSWAYRNRLKGVMGGVASPWWRVDDFYMGSRLFEIVSCSNHLWSATYPDPEGYNRIIQRRMPEIRTALKGVKPPSRDGNPVRALDIASSFNTRPTDRPRDLDLGLLRHGTVKAGPMVFELPNPDATPGNLCAVVAQNSSGSGAKATRSQKIAVDKDVSSLVFLHACAYRADRRDILGWYRIVYEDGLEVSVPIEYEVNIREWSLLGTDPKTGKRSQWLITMPWTAAGALCYESDMINCSVKPDTELNFFAFEWRNRRFGVKIKEVYLEGAKGSAAAAKEEFFTPKELADNAVALVALSYVPKRDVTASKAK